MANKYLLSDIENILPGQIDVFICSASFELRCASVARKISSRIEKTFIIQNEDGREASDANLASLQLMLKDSSVIPASRESPTMTASAFSKGIIPELQKASAGNILIDITTFTHEQLLILIALLKNKSAPAKATFAYTSAKEYSFNTDEDKVWLSRGVRQVRSVLGYSGQFAPSKRLHLMILAGFESERAQTLIEIMEPARLSLGTGDINHSVSQEHYSRNERFFSRLKSFVEHQIRMDAEVDTFKFSCVDPFDARDTILAQAAKYSDFNTVVSPMNTKVSTVGAGLAALESEKIQIAYALPAEYNKLGYSTPGDMVTLFDLSFSKLN